MFEACVHHVLLLGYDTSRAVPYSSLWMFSLSSQISREGVGVGAAALHLEVPYSAEMRVLPLL